MLHADPVDLVHAEQQLPGQLWCTTTRGGQYQTDRRTDRQTGPDTEADIQTARQYQTDTQSRRYKLVPDKTDRQRTDNVSVKSRWQTFRTLI